MKKRKAGLVFIVLVVFIAVSWYRVIQNHNADELQYQECISAAESFEEKGIYVDALNLYKEILKRNPDNYEIVMKKADMYYKMGDEYGFINTCDEAISIDKTNLEAYIKKAEYYIDKMQYTEALKIVDEAGLLKSDERIEQLKLDLSSKYVEKYGFFSEINDWHVSGDVNYVAVKENSSWGMVLKDGTRQIHSKFDYLGAYDENTKVIPCCEAGIYYYIDESGNKKLVGDNEYQYLGSFGSGFAPAQRNNLFGYIDTDFNELHFEYEYAGAFANNIAAVKKAGKWALIDRKFNKLTEFEYDEILMDSNGYCSMYEVIIARKNGKYIFVNHKGEQIGSNEFDAAGLAASDDGYIAVKIGGSWGYSDNKGNIVIKAQYDNAKSFSLGLAPVMVDDMWGYINTSGELVIEAKYSDAKVFSKDGSAPVKNYDIWSFIVLCRYDD